MKRTSNARGLQVVTSEKINTSLTAERKQVARGRDGRETNSPPVSYRNPSNGPRLNAQKSGQCLTHDNPVPARLIRDNKTDTVLDLLEVLGATFLFQVIQVIGQSCLNDKRSFDPCQQTTACTRLYMKNSRSGMLSRSKICVTSVL